MRILIKWILSKNKLANYVLGNDRMQGKSMYHVVHGQDIIYLINLKMRECLTSFLNI